MYSHFHKIKFISASKPLKGRDIEDRVRGIGHAGITLRSSFASRKASGSLDLVALLSGANRARSIIEIPPFE